MLILSRRVGEKICIGDDVIITVVEVRGKAVRIAISAPTSIAVNRQEIHNRIQSEKSGATTSGE